MARKLLKFLFTGCFCVCLAWFAAKIVFHFVASPAELPRPEAKAPVKKSPVQPSSPGSSYEITLKRNLFHAALERPAAQVNDVASAGLTQEEEERLLAEMGALPVSKMGWTLLGTVVNTITPSESRAILLVEGKQTALAPAAEIKGWKIILIERRMVALEKNGKRERLVVGGAEAAKETARSRETQKPGIRAAEIERAMNNLPELLKQVGLAPAAKQGIQGLNLTFVKPDSLPAKLGLRANDLLTSANGRALTNPADLAALASAAKEKSLRIELVRDGRDMVIEYDIRR